MSEDTLVHLPWYRQRIVLFVASSIVIACLLVVVSMALYASSGAAQLDLSRPGYKSVQNEVDQNDNFESFPANGSVDSKTVDQFLKLYDKQTQPVNNANVFTDDALSDQALGIDAPGAAQ